MLHLEQARRPHIKQSKTSANLSGEVFGTLINLSGRRRFTSQRALVEGTDQVQGIFCDELQGAYFGASQSDEVIRDFIGLAERALDAIEAGSRAAPSLLERLVESTTPLVFYETALAQHGAGAAASERSANVFVSSENTLSVMDKVTGMYARLTA